jgi:hypothetical protein
MVTLLQLNAYLEQVPLTDRYCPIKSALNCELQLLLPLPYSAIADCCCQIAYNI